MRKKTIFKGVFTLCFAVTTSFAYAQNINTSQLPILKTDRNSVNIIADGHQQTGAWIVNPSIRPDVFETSAKKVTFRSSIDSISFNIEKEGIYDFAIVANNVDSAMTQIKWVSSNPLEEPSQRILRRSSSGLLSKEQANFDIDALIYTIGEVHPNMFSVSKSDDFFKAVNNVKQQITDSVSTAQLFRLTAPLVTKIGDGHTMLRFPYNVFLRKRPKDYPCM